MAGGYLTTYGATAILNGDPHPVVLYAAGHLGNPGPDAIANAAAETRRLAVNLATAVGGVVENVGSSNFSNAGATEDWNYLSLWDLSTLGNPWWIVDLTGAPLSIVAGETVGIATAVLSLSFELWS